MSKASNVPFLELGTSEDFSLHFIHMSLIFPYVKWLIIREKIK